MSKNDIQNAIVLLILQMIVLLLVGALYFK